MLIEMKVSNFAIIDELHLQFKNGLNIISGETGAGKSVLLKSLNLLMGDKSSPDLIRSGKPNASIEGQFDLSDRKDLIQILKDYGIAIEDDTLIVRRVLSHGDKSKVYLNGALSTLAQLREIVSPLVEVTGHSAPLIEMTGQHENKNLLSKSYHLDLLDSYLGLSAQKLEYKNLFQRYSNLKSEIQRLTSEEATRAQRLDFLIYQRDEISALDLSPGEDEMLETEAKRMKNLSKLMATMDSFDDVLNGDSDSAISRIALVSKRSFEMTQLDPSLEPHFEKISQASELINDFLYATRKSISQIDFDAEKLEELENRLSQFRKLQKKYGSSLQEILKQLVDVENEIHRLETSDQNLEKFQKELSDIEKKLHSQAMQIHEKRKNGSQVLSNSVNQELSDLNMKGVTFSVQTEKLMELRSDGISDVEFMCQTSPKDPIRALAKTASGGELSRILLSLKRVVGSGQLPRTYLFDEVDTGVSGQTAEKVGRKLKSIAKGQQVICVTHLPQVAAFADFHFVISKESIDDRAVMTVNELKPKDRVKEIARLISGEKVTKTSLAHAEELLSLK
ncbi:MAG: DNA repair protein RecN [Pseudobdellovibrionaceae bacterium]